MGIFICEVFGLVAAVTRRLVLIRIYALLSAVAALTVFASSLLRVIIHFTEKNDLISECTTLSTGDEIIYRFGLFGPIRSERLSPGQADAWCRRAWDRDSWAEIVSLLITLFLGVMFSIVAFAYYRQMLDPSSPANASRAPSSQVRMEIPTYYNPPYNASVPNLGYNPSPQYQPQYAPPAGPPPVHRDETFVPPHDSKPPGYTGAGRLDADDKENPFADFDGPSNRDFGERDVTSRPGPDGRDTFR
ncbi:hypothetical protein HGRIS_010006 [Hohenbuehelia grisea]|uniref:MARVEL domain-containing protein n=1 Tax=Hohenbuehelia grisea TaxID=104357 RepID=A0ABR3J3C8_9AGAR